MPTLGVCDGDTVRTAALAVMTLAEESAAPAETLSSSYEQLLAYSPCISAGRFSLQRSVERRRRSGSFYTPAPVARAVVEAALEPLMDGGKPPTVLDPAMGAGIFLLETARYLRRRLEQTGHPARVVAERCLHGLDSDPLAVEAATLSIWLETGARPGALARNLRRGDLLREQSSLGRFDAVVGNPPWGARYTPARREQLARRFPRSTTGTFDSFKLFLDAGSSLCRGTVGMVVPQAVLSQTTHADIRAVLLGRLDPYSAVNLRDGVFAGAAAPACILVFGRKPGPSQVRCLDRRSGQDVRHAVPASLWSAERFPLQSVDRLAVLQRLRKHPTLGEMAHLYRVRDVGINYNRAAVAGRVLYAGPEPEDVRDLARYRGRDFGRYTTTRPGGWLRHNARELLQPGERLSIAPATYRLPEKIVFRQTADRIVATLDRSGMAMGRSVIAVTREADVSLRALLGCLNSHLMTVMYRALAGEEGRVLPQVKVGTVAALPVLAVCSSPVPKERLDRGCDPASALLEDALRGDDAALMRAIASDPFPGWVCLDRLVDVMLRQEGRNTDVDRMIDRIVYRLYGLSEAEIAVVEPARETWVAE